MLKRTRGLVLLLCLVLCAACASDDGVAVIEAMTVEGPALYTDTLTALESEMAQVAMKRAWSGSYFSACTVQGAAVQESDLFVWVFNGRSRHYEVHSLNAKTGTRNWMVDVGDRNLEHLPMAGDRFVVCLLQDGAGMVVVNRANGARAYTMSTRVSQVPTGPAASSDSTVYLNSLIDDRVHALNPATGMSGWAFRTAGTITAGPITTPRLPRRLVVFGTDAGEVVALPPRAWNESRPSDPAWDRNVFGDVSGPISVAKAIVGDKLQVSVLVPCEDHGLYCLDAATGEPRWVYRTAHPFRGAARALGGRVFGRNERRLCVVDLATGDEAWAASAEDGETKPFETAFAAVAADDTRAYLWMGGKKIVRADGATGAFIAGANLASFDWIVPGGENNVLVGVTRDGYLVAFN